MTIAPVSAQTLSSVAPPQAPTTPPASSAKSQAAQDTVHLSPQATAAASGDGDGDGH